MEAQIYKCSPEDLLEFCGAVVTKGLVITTDEDMSPARLNEVGAGGMFRIREKHVRVKVLWQVGDTAGRVEVFVFNSIFHLRPIASKRLFDRINSLMKEFSFTEN